MTIDEQLPSYLDINALSATQSNWLDLLPDAVALFDNTGSIRLKNKAFKTFLQENLLLCLPELTCELLDAQLQKIALPDSQIHVINYKQHLQQRDSPPPQKSLILLATPQSRVIQKETRFSNEDNGIAGLIHIRDITRNYHIDQRKTQFLCTTAHELRAPMANIFGYTELLINNHYEYDNQQKMLAVIYQETARMLKILNDLLDLARIEAQDKSALELDKHYLSDLVKHILETQKQILMQHDIAVSTQEEQPVCCDRTKIEQVLINILDNAVKYTEPGTTITINIRLDQHQQTAGIRIEIIDQGVGISPSQLPRIFDRFYRGQTSQTVLGTGLGMSIVKEIINLHCGTIDISSFPNKGTKVNIWLPL
jgi:signal transduction histidine kinase